MKHYIIVKFKEGFDYRSIKEPVEALFRQMLTIEGIHDVEVRLSNSERANRFDMMILIHMDPEALTAYDASEPHHQWKAQYGPQIAAKTIFDCD